MPGPFDDLIPQGQNSAVPTQQGQQTNSNPFEDLVPQQTGGNAASAPSGFQSMVDGFEAMNYQFGRLARGTLGLASYAVPGSQGFRDKLTKLGQEEAASLAEAQQRSPAATTGGSLAGAIGSGIAYGAPIAAAMPAAGLGGAVAQGSATGFGLGFLDEADSIGQRVKKGAVGALIGGAAGGLGYGIGSGWQAIKKNLIAPKEAALKNLADDIAAQGQNADDVMAAVKPSREILDDTPTPGQAMFQEDAPLVSSKEAGLNLNDTQRQVVTNKVLQQSAKTKQAINSTIDKIAPKGTKELKDTLYAQLSTQQLDDTAMSELRQNPVIAKELERIGKSEISIFKDLPDNSFTKLEEAKVSIDNALRFNVFGESTAKLSYGEKEGLRQARQLLVSTLDKNTEYASARQAAQKLIVKDYYGKLLNKLGKQPTLKDVNTKLFGSEEKIQAFLDDVAETGGDVESATKIIDLAKTMSDSTLKRTISRQKDIGSYITTNTQGITDKVANKLFGGRYKKAVLDLALDQKWPEKVSEILSQPTKTKAQESLLTTLFDVTSKGSKAATASTRSIIGKGIKNSAILGANRALSGYLGE